MPWGRPVSARPRRPHTSVFPADPAAAPHRSALTGAGLRRDLCVFSIKLCPPTWPLCLPGVSGTDCGGPWAGRVGGGGGREGGVCFLLAKGLWGKDPQLFHLGLFVFFFLNWLLVHRV